jgi:hypothetical protein
MRKFLFESDSYHHSKGLPRELKPALWPRRVGSPFTMAIPDHAISPGEVEPRWAEINQILFNEDVNT